MSLNIGMMEGAYFVSRGELLSWLNGLLSLNYTKVEQTASGAALCQILDSIFPGRVPLNKVNFNARLEWEYIKNLKVLQESFLKLGIDKVVDIPRLSRGKYQDNLEFLQWMKRYWDLKFSGTAGSYNAEERRAQAGCKAIQTPSPSSSTATTSTAPARRTVTAPPKRSSNEKTATTTAARSGGAAAAAKPRVAKENAAQNSPARSHSETQKEAFRQITELKKAAEALENERDFYFAKLRDVEVLIQALDESTPELVREFALRVQAILYATDDQPNDDASGVEPLAPLSPVATDAE